MEAEKELDVLEHIYHNADSVRQRDLAHVAGVSLGMINVILKRLAAKGWIKIKKINNRNIQYVVSPEGLDAISHRSYDFFKRTVKNLVIYKDVLEALVLEIKRKGYSSVMLVGPSQVDFLVEHFCLKYGLVYRAVKCGEYATIAGERTYQIYSEDTENRAEDSGLTEEEGVYLREVLIG